MSAKDYLKQFALSPEEVIAKSPSFSDVVAKMSSTNEERFERERTKGNHQFLEVVERLRISDTFSEDDDSALDVFTSSIDAILRVANRINNFNSGNLRKSDPDLSLPILFNLIVKADTLDNVSITLGKALKGFLPHLFSVVKRLQHPARYPVFYPYTRNIIKEVFGGKTDYDSICEFYQSLELPGDDKAISFETYLYCLGQLIIDGIDDSALEFGSESKNRKFLSEKVITRSDLKSQLNAVPKGANGVKYWLYAPGENASKWEEFYEQGIIGLGWDEIGDLNLLGNKEDIIQTIQKKYNTESKSYNNARANLEFRDEISLCDIVITKKGRQEYLGYGIVTSDYYYDSGRDTYQKCRKVDWKKKGVWKAPKADIVLKTLTDITKYPDYVDRLISLIGIEQVEKSKSFDMPLALNTIFYGPPGTGKTYLTIQRAAEIVSGRTFANHQEAQKVFNSHLHEQIEFITFHQNYSYEDFIQGLRPDVENRGQLSFERKDGIFKVLANRASENLEASLQGKGSKLSFEKVFNEFFQGLIEGDVEELEIKMKKVSYFITGIGSHSIDFRKSNGNTEHTLSIATLKRMYQAESVLDIQGLASYYRPILEQFLAVGKSKGATKPIERKNYVIIIDEINRANISRVFGELITLIEDDKRSQGATPLKAKLPSGDTFQVPSNLYIIGTMNTADKSIALLDIALRRRFEFEPMFPLYEINDEPLPFADILRKINQEIITKKGHDFQIGHAYFMKKGESLQHIMNRKVIPLLLEYFMNDEDEVRSILKTSGLIVDENQWPLRITAEA